MTSAYKTEIEHGIIIYADNYVKIGSWVYDCDYARLISRTPYPPPLKILLRPKSSMLAEEFYI